VAKLLYSRHKKTGQGPVSSKTVILRGCKFCRVGQCRGLSGLDLSQGIAYHFLGKAGTLTALRGYAEGFTHVTKAAAALVDRIANLAIGDTLAKTDIHT
jgi:hypothetical protein